MKSLIFLFLIMFLTNLTFALCEDTQININSASAKELDKIIGIGPAYAEKIILERPFSSIDDLIRINGIGNITLNKIKTQGLACVSDEEEQVEDKEDKEATIEESTKKEKNQSINSSKSQIEEEIIEPEQEPETIFLSNNEDTKVINLNPKTIKIQENSLFQDKGKYVYLFLGFCVLLAILYFIQNKGKRKNEFR